MADIIKCKINVNKVDKSKMFKGEKGTYLDVTLLPNKNGTDEYGNDYMIVQDVSKADREAGVKGAILGNAKVWAKSAPKEQPPAGAPAGSAPTDAGDDIPW